MQKLAFPIGIRISDSEFSRPCHNGLRPPCSGSCGDPAFFVVEEVAMLLSRLTSVVAWLAFVLPATASETITYAGVG